jgi:hypothetical protein
MAKRKWRKTKPGRKQHENKEEIIDLNYSLSCL